MIPSEGSIQFILQDATTNVHGANISYTLRGERMPPKEFSFTHPGGDRASQPFEVEMPEGAEVVGLNVGHTAQRGQSYLAVFIRHRKLRVTRLARGYVYSGSHLDLGQNDEMLGPGHGTRVTNEGASTLVNATLLTRTIVVPTNVRWRVIGGQVLQADDVARDVLIILNDGTQDLVRLREETDAAANDVISYPGLDDISGGSELQAESFLLVAADEVLITWRSGGASAGGTARSSCVVEEWIEL